MRFPYYHQLDAMDCGPTCLRMVAKHYSKHYSLETLRQKSFIGREGVSMLGSSTAAESIGFRTIGVHISPSSSWLKPRCLASCIGNRTISWSSMTSKSGTIKNAPL